MHDFLLGQMPVGNEIANADGVENGYVGGIAPYGYHVVEPLAEEDEHALAGAFATIAPRTC